MSKPKPSPTEAAIYHANASFYRAFSVGDYGAMAQLWAERAPVSCVHPGMPALHGRETVMESWRQIMTGGSPFEMRADHPQVSVFGETAIVTCYEGNDQQPAHLAATNIFVLERGQWRMVHHHAGPLARTLGRESASALN